MSTILVTGAQGTIGRPLVKELEMRGNTVVGVDLMHVPGFLNERCDIRDYRQLERTFKSFNFDYVYHLAAEFGRHNGNEYYEQCLSTNLIGTRNVIELCKKHNVRLIFASSSEIYGELNKDYLVEEDDQLPLRPANDYAISKWASELQIINEEAISFSFNAVRCRFFNAYGPGEHYHPYRSVVCLFCNKALLGEGWTVYRDYSRVFMYIDDFIPTLANICTNFIPGRVYNIGGRDFRSVEELSDLVLNLTEADPARVTELSLDRHNTRNKRPDNIKAEDELGHDPKWILEDGVPKYLAWLRNLREDS